MAFRSRGKDPEAARAEEAVKAAAPKPDLSSLLAHERVAKDLAASYPDSPNCDAMKAALSNAAHGIAHVRKVLAQNARLA